MLQTFLQNLALFRPALSSLAPYYFKVIYVFHFKIPELKFGEANTVLIFVSLHVINAIQTRENLQSFLGILNGFQK